MTRIATHSAKKPAPAAVAEVAARALSRPVEDLEVLPLAGHASARTYYRVRAGPSPAAPRVVVMALPEDPARGEEVGSDTPGELPFLAVGRYLEALGVRVPAVHLADVAGGFIVLEDLGETTLEDAYLSAKDDAPRRRKLYGRAVDQLAFMRRQAELRPDPGGPAFQRAFDFDLLRWELDHFREWLLEADRGVVLESGERRVLDAAFDEIATRLAGLPRGLTHRDYQSRNLMVVAGDLAVIDFQDALQGPMVYDLVALLRDSYVVLGRPVVDEMLDRYTDAYRSLGGVPPEREVLDEAFDLMTVQRKLKDAGRFVFIDRQKGNPDFLPHVPASLAYVSEALARLPELRKLREILARHLPELNRPEP